MGTTKKTRLSLTLAGITVVVAVMLGFVVGSMKIYMDLAVEEQSRRAIVEEILSVAQPSATRAVVRLDAELAQEVVAGLMEYDYIISAVVVDDLGRILAQDTRADIGTSRTRWITRLFTNEIIEARTPLAVAALHGGESGSLEVLVDQDLYLAAFYGRATLELITGVLQSLVLAFVLLAIYNATLTQPLRRMARQLEAIDPARPKSNAITVPDGHKTDELGDLANAGNRLVEAIRRLLNDQLDIRKRLALARDELEFRVNERTAELKHEIRERLRAEEQLKHSNVLLEDRVRERTKELSSEVERHKATLFELSAMKEAADSANRAKTSFLANMSHELRTPLNAIVGFTAIMKEEMFGPLGNDRYKQYMVDIEDSGRHLSEILGNILDLAKVEAGELNLHLEEVAIEPMIASCTKMFALMAAGQKIDISIDVAASLPNLKIDELRIKQIIINLISNALKFTPEGGHIKIRATETPDGILMQVIDTGEGIPADKLQAVLEPFAQAGGSFDKTYQGVGLGLSLSRSLIELHGGSLWLESELGQGTTVNVLFPQKTIVTPPEDAKVV